MFRIRITGGAPGRTDLDQSCADRTTAERLAQALVGYLGRHRLPGYRQGVQVIDDQGRGVWRQEVGAAPERPN